MSLWDKVKKGTGDLVHNAGRVISPKGGNYNILGLKAHLSNTDQRLIAGIALGAATGGIGSGAVLGGALVGMYGSKMENWLQSTWEGVSGKTAANNAEIAAKKADRARQDAIIKEMGARTQADTLSAAMARSRNGNNSDMPGVVGGQGAPGGLIGESLGTSGTF